MIEDLSQRDRQRLILSVGTHRGDRPLSPMEVSDLLALAIEGGSTRKDCAEFLDVGTTQVSTFLRLQDLGPSLRHLAAWGAKDGGIAFSTLAQLVSLDGADQETAASAILEAGLTWKEVTQLVQIRRRSGAEIRVAIKRVLDLRPVFEIRHVVVCSVRSAKLRSVLGAMTQHERDVELRDALRMVDSLASARGRLGSQAMTIVLEDIQGVDPDVIEDTLNGLIERQVLYS